VEHITPPARVRGAPRQLTATTAAATASVRIYLSIYYPSRTDPTRTAGRVVSLDDLDRGGGSEQVWAGKHGSGLTPAAPTPATPC